MLAALTTSLVSLPVTVPTQGAAFAVHCLVSRFLSASGSAEGSIRYFRLAGEPMPSSQDVALPQMIRPGP
jgi:hypothetical protein